MQWGESAPSLLRMLQTNLVDHQRAVAAVMSMQKHQKALPRLTYTISHPVFLIYFGFLTSSLSDFCAGGLSWGLLLQLNLWHTIGQVGTSDEHLQCNAWFQCSVKHPHCFGFPIHVAPYPPLLQFYFHLITSISLAHHIKVSFSPGNQQQPQLCDCSELSFMLLRFFSITMFFS